MAGTKENSTKMSAYMLRMNNLGSIDVICVSLFTAGWFTYFCIDPYVSDGAIGVNLESFFGTFPSPVIY